MATLLTKYMQDAADEGRYGDTEIIHVNKDEVALLEEYRGAELDVNPVTGLGEAFVDPITATTAGISMLGNIYSGWKQGQAYDEAEIAAEQIKQERLQLADEKQGIAIQGTEDAFRTGQESLDFTANTNLRKMQIFGDSAYSKSNMANVGSIDAKINQQQNDMIAQYQSQMTKLFQTRNLERRKIDLKGRSDEIAAEQEYQNRLAGMDPGGAGQGAWEGLNQALSIIL